jgi:hypothetical protein
MDYLMSYFLSVVQLWKNLPSPACVQRTAHLNVKSHLGPNGHLATRRLVIQVLIISIKFQIIFVLIWHNLLKKAVWCIIDGTRGELNQQERYRVVLEGQNCEPLVERRSCYEPKDPCPIYHWTEGNWSPCQLATGVRCGHGLRTRGSSIVYWNFF